jgi:hypothetical protein
VVISEAVVTTPQEVAEATAAALAAGRTLLGPLAWAGLDDDRADRPRQVIERVEGFGEDAPAAGDGGPPRIEVVSGPGPAMSGGRREGDAGGLREEEALRRAGRGIVTSARPGIIAGEPRTNAR